MERERHRKIDKREIGYNQHKLMPYCGNKMQSQRTVWKFPTKN